MKLREAAVEVDQEIVTLLKRVARSFRPDQLDDDVEVSQGKDGLILYSIGVRKYDFFTPRPGEEDDDWPELNSKAKVITPALEKAFKDKPGYKNSGFGVDEKYWFTIDVMIDPKAAPKKKPESPKAQWKPFSKHDWMTWADAEKFANGDLPKVLELKVDGKDATAMYEKGGIEVEIFSDDDSEIVSLQNYRAGADKVRSAYLALDKKMTKAELKKMGFVGFDGKF